jgi:hypothetical protein
MSSWSEVGQQHLEQFSLLMRPEHARWCCLNMALAVQELPPLVMLWQHPSMNLQPKVTVMIPSVLEIGFQIRILLHQEPLQQQQLLRN